MPAAVLANDGGIIDVGTGARLADAEGLSVSVNGMGAAAITTYST